MVICGVSRPSADTLLLIDVTKCADTTSSLFPWKLLRPLGLGKAYDDAVERELGIKQVFESGQGATC